VSHKTLCKCIKELQNSISTSVTKTKCSLVLGGDVECGANVELDESLFGKKCKYHKGKVHQRSWVFGIVERHSRNLVLEVVRKRDKATLMPIINEHVSKAAIINHDDWASYRSLANYGYQHKIVIHSKEFKSKDGAHTNTIEGVWGVLKQRLGRMHGLRHQFLPLFLDEYSFRYSNKGHVLSALLKSLKINKSHPIA
jgi:IS1 family transposase